MPPKRNFSNRLGEEPGSPDCLVLLRPEWFLGYALPASSLLQQALLLDAPGFSRGEKVCQNQAGASSCMLFRKNRDSPDLDH